MHTASVRGRKRRNQHPLAWDPSNEVRANMPRASGLHGAHAPIVKRPYANIIYGREQDEDVADALVDTLDVVVPRDLAAARYALYHEWMDKLLGPTRLDQMTAPAPVYDDKSLKKLESDIQTLQNEWESAKAAHAEKLKAFNAPVDDKSEEAEAEPWAQAPSAGRILGIGYVPTDIPADVAAHLQAQAERRREREAQQPPPSKTPEEIQAMIQEVNQRHQGTPTVP